MQCLYCHNELSGWKRLVGSGGRFCSEEHAEQWRSELAEIAVKRLLTVRARLRAVYGLTPLPLRKAG